MKVQRTLCSCQVVCQCCEEADPSSALEKLTSRVKEGRLGEGALLRLLRAVQQKAPSSFPTPLLSLVEEAEGNTQEPEENQSGGKEEHFVSPCEWISSLSIQMHLQMSTLTKLKWSLFPVGHSTAVKPIYIQYTAVRFISCWWGNGNCSN